MKIFAAGIATETNTFCPIPTGIEDFSICRGADVINGRAAPSFNLYELWGTRAEAQGHEFVLGIMAWAQPSGKMVRAAYEQLRDELLRELRAAMPIDIALLMLHGAMIAEEYGDCEEDLLCRARAIVGRDSILAVELDLHCHLSPSKIAAADIVLTYKEYPHDDINTRAAELYDLAMDARLGRIDPIMALFDCQMVGQYPTSRQPMRDFVATLLQAEHRRGVLSVSFGHGFPFADVPHMGAKVLVVADGDRKLAEETAQEFGRKAYAIRKQIGFDSFSLPMAEALSRALGAQRTPVVVAEQSDNPGAGAPSDATFALKWLLQHAAEEVAMGIFYDPEVVKTARKAGKGATLRVRLGGKLGPSSGDPVDLTIEVISVRENYLHVFPQQSGQPLLFALGDVAALRCEGIDIVVSSERCQCYSPSVFSDLEIDLSRKRTIVVKSTQHFYGAFAGMAAEILYMAGPGAVSPDPRELSYEHVDTTRMYPWAADPQGE